mgnify:CR=1 FL=1
MSRTFPAAHLLSAYGMTEACSSMTFRHLRGPAHPASTNAGGWQQRPQQLQQLQLWAPPGSNNSSKPVGSLTQPDAAMEGAVCVGWPAPGVQIRVVRTEAADQPHQAHTQGAQKFQQVANSSCTSSYGGTASGRQVPPRTSPGQPPRQQGTARDQERAAAGETCGPHELGEVQTRGPHTLLRYWRDDDATAKVNAGWSGCMHHVGRTSEDRSGCGAQHPSWRAVVKTAASLTCRTTRAHESLGPGFHLLVGLSTHANAGFTIYLSRIRG